MAVNVGDSITASQYNGLQSRIDQVLGNGSTDFGYGQALASSQVSAPSSPGAGDGDSVTALQMQNLHDDMTKVFTHQTGNPITIKDIVQGDIIGADETGTDLTFDPSDGSYTFDNADITGGFNDYLSLMDTLELNRFNIAVGQSDVADLDTDDRTTSWNGNIDLEFSITFTDTNARRHFFNSGGQIRVDTILEYGLVFGGGASAKDTDWKAMLENPGQIQLGINYTTITGSSTGVTLATFGNDGLTGTYQTIFEKGGNDAEYAENRYKIQARVNSGNAAILEFKVLLEDNDVGDRPDPSPPPPYGALVDESVTGEITTTISARRSDVQVVLPYPAVSKTNTYE